MPPKRKVTEPSPVASRTRRAAAGTRNASRTRANNNSNTANNTTTTTRRRGRPKVADDDDEEDDDEDEDDSDYMFETEESEFDTDDTTSLAPAHLVRRIVGNPTTTTSTNHQQQQHMYNNPTQLQQHRMTQPMQAHNNSNVDMHNPIGLRRSYLGPPHVGVVNNNSTVNNPGHVNMAPKPTNIVHSASSYLHNNPPTTFSRHTMGGLQANNTTSSTTIIASPAAGSLNNNNNLLSPQQLQQPSQQGIQNAPVTTTTSSNTTTTTTSNTTRRQSSALKSVNQQQQQQSWLLLITMFLLLLCMILVGGMSLILYMNRDRLHIPYLDHKISTNNTNNFYADSNISNNNNSYTKALQQELSSRFISMQEFNTSQARQNQDILHTYRKDLKKREERYNTTFIDIQTKLDTKHDKIAFTNFKEELNYELQAINNELNNINTSIYKEQQVVGKLSQNTTDSIKKLENKLLHFEHNFQSKFQVLVDDIQKSIATKTSDNITEKDEKNIQYDLNTLLINQEFQNIIHNMVQPLLKQLNITLNDIEKMQHTQNLFNIQNFTKINTQYDILTGNINKAQQDIVQMKIQYDDLNKNINNKSIAQQTLITELVDQYNQLTHDLLILQQQHKIQNTTLIDLTQIVQNNKNYQQQQQHQQQPPVTSTNTQQVVLIQGFGPRAVDIAHLSQGTIITAHSPSYYTKYTPDGRTLSQHLESIITTTKPEDIYTENTNNLPFLSLFNTNTLFPSSSSSSKSIPSESANGYPRIAYQHAHTTPYTVLDEVSGVGDCFTFDTDGGNIYFQLNAIYTITNITIDHINPNIDPYPSAAPHNIAIYGLNLKTPGDAENDDNIKSKGHLAQITNETFLMTAAFHKPQRSANEMVITQTFDIPLQQNINANNNNNNNNKKNNNDNKRQFNGIRINVLSNHGHKDFTNLYRIRVHGIPVRGIIN